MSRAEGPISIYYKQCSASLKILYISHNHCIAANNEVLRCLRNRIQRDIPSEYRLPKVVTHFDLICNTCFVGRIHLKLVYESNLKIADNN